MRKKSSFEQKGKFKRTNNRTSTRPVIRPSHVGQHYHAPRKEAAGFDGLPTADGDRAIIGLTLGVFFTGEGGGKRANI